ncbi:MAG: hypothetical protein ACOCWW_02435 [Bacteroidota bacterium]
MIRERLLQDLFKRFDFEYKEISEEYKYIGTGNPNAGILIIGKEVAIESNVFPDQYRIEVIDNFRAWKKMECYDQELVRAKDWANYSPLYPYKGQVLKINNDKNEGTSRTWYNYQKLCNHIFKITDNQDINFHEKIFITEVNSTPSPKTKNASRDSIPFRKEHFLSSEFIQSFPIVLICGVGYFHISDTSNEIEEIFKVKFSEKKIANDNEKQPYWLHWNPDKTKLLINTYQLSMNVSDALLQDVANIIKNSNLL